jgi:hypothetical protein
MPLNNKRAATDELDDAVLKRRKYDCAHGKYKYHCKECGGSSICKHDRQRPQCKECGGSGICEHDRQRSQCKECGGSQICEHNHKRSTCKECGGSSICEHKRERCKCKECGGSGICEHDRRRSDCKECGGVSICEHDRHRYSCKECVSLEKQLTRKSFCKVGCGTILSALRKHTGLCAGCDAVAPRMQWITWDLIKAELPEPTFKDNKLIGGDACATKRSRPDFGWVLPDRIVYLEIDEHSHEDREISCELAKLDSANWGLAESGTVMAKLPTFMIRFNCSEYDRARISLEDRCETLFDYVQQKLTEDVAAWDVMRLNVSFLYYHSKSDKHMEAAENHTNSVLVHEIIQ